MKSFFKFFIVIVLITSVSLFTGCIDRNAETRTGESWLFSDITEKPSMAPRLIDSNQLSSSIEVSKNVSPAVVGISSQSGQSYSVGSGVAIAKNGYILSNNHVIINPNSIDLYLADGNTATGTLIWADKNLDLAIIKSSKNLPYLRIADDKSAKVGQDVLAIGTPLQLQFKHSVTKGIVSALNRTVKVDTQGGESYLQSLIQHDASINPGNSGGPLINLNSQVVGINTLKIEAAEGIGFAIPASVIKNVVKNVVADGTYQSAYLGVFGYDAAISNYYKKSESEKGVYVISVQEDSPAQKAGLEKGDVILSVNNKPTNTMLEFRREFYSYKAGEKVEVKYIQNGHTKIVELTLREKPQNKKAD